MSIRETHDKRNWNAAPDGLEPRLHRIHFDPNEDRTRQEFAEESSMDFLVKKWLNEGRQTPAYTPQNFGDFTQGTDFLTAWERVQAVQETFDQLPSATRKALGHNPANLVDYVESLTEAEIDEAVDLGILTRPDAIAVTRTADAPAPAPPPDPEPAP